MGDTWRNHVNAAAASCQRVNYPHQQRAFDSTRCDYLMTSSIKVEEVTCNFPPPESPYEPCQEEGRVSFFWNGLDAKDELVQNSRNRPKHMNWMCGFCYHWTVTKDELEEHLRNVHESKARFHVCKTCGKRFVTRFLLRRHEAVHQYEPTLPHSCYVNSWGIPVKELVENHFLNGVRPANPTAETIADALATFKSIAEGVVSCVSCSREFKDYNALAEHHEDVHAAIYCKLCGHLGKLYPTMSDLKIHLIDVHDLEYLTYFDQGHSKIWKRIKAEERFQEIGNSFVKFFHSYAKNPTCLSWNKVRELNIAAFLERKRAQTRSYSNGEESDSGVADVPVAPESPPGVSSESVASSGNGARKRLAEVMKEITQEEEPEVTTVEEELQRGILSSRTRKMGAPRRSCHVCKKLITYAAFQKHIDDHTELRFKCMEEGCKKRFLSRSALQLHQRSHSEDRPFKCELCPRAYNYGSLLKRHLRTHTGEMPYGCDMCGKRFHELVSLNYHRKKVHTGERPHRCDLCDKAFILAHDLKKHKISHEKQTIPLGESQKEVPVLAAGPKKKRVGRINQGFQRRHPGAEAGMVDEDGLLVHYEFMEEEPTQLYEEGVLVL